MSINGASVTCYNNQSTTGCTWGQALCTTNSDCAYSSVGYTEAFTCPIYLNSVTTPSWPLDACAGCSVSCLSTPTPCPAGSACAVPGLSVASLCPTGTYAPLVGMTACLTCPMGANCTGVGLSSYAPVSCAAGQYCPVVVQNASNGVLCTMGSAGCAGTIVSSPAGLPCPAGWYCGANASMPLPCPAGSMCAAGAVAPVSCSVSLLTSAAVSSVCNQPVYVSTLAGGAGGFQDGVGTNAKLSDPTGLAFDVMGNMFISDRANQRIRMITPAGVVTMAAGSGAAGFADGSGVAASFNSPQGVCVDQSTGIVYIADVGNHRIRQLHNGMVSTLAGSGVAGWADGVGVAAIFNRPSGVACDSSGTVYIGDTSNSRVRRIVVSTRQVSTLGGGTTSGFTNGFGTLALFRNPEGLRWIPSSNMVLVADISNNAIRQISASGAVTTVAGTGAAGTMDGTALTATFTVPCDVIVDASGNIYVNDNGAGTIRKISVSGSVTTVAGLAGSWGQAYADGFGSSARFSAPNRLALDRRGILYVGDHPANRVRAVRVNGASSTCAAGQYGSMVTDSVSQSASCSPCAAGLFCPEGMR